MFIYLLPSTTAKGLDHIAENILSYLDAKSLCAAELVCKEWYRVISDGMLWKKLIERMVLTDSLWHGLAERRGWYVYRHLIFSYLVLCLYALHVDKLDLNREVK